MPGSRISEEWLILLLVKPAGLCVYTGVSGIMNGSQLLLFKLFVNI